MSKNVYSVNKNISFKGILFPEAVLHNKELSINERVLYAYLCSYDICYDNEKEITEYIPMSENAIKVCINNLIALGYAEKLRLENGQWLLRDKADFWNSGKAVNNG